MAHPARYLNSIVLLLLLAACNARRPAVPRVFVRADDARLQQRSGSLYFGGEPFAGFVFELYPNGDTASTTGYYKGREEGIQQRRYAGSARLEERYYEDGRKEGTHRAWWPDGKPKFTYHFVHDRHEGSAEEWFVSGQPFRRFQYREGQEDGRQQMWWPDGTVRANYVVKEGQQYGLIGRKLCINPAHETK